MADMVEYRICEAGDIPQLRCLWKLVFEDSDGFLDFYFTQRFVPSHSVCTLVDGEIVGAIFGLPCHMSVGGVMVKSAMSSGFCTHPDHRGKGYFSTLYPFYLHVLRENGVILAPNTPVYHESYFRFETRTVSQACYLTGRISQILPSTATLLSLGDLGQMVACYDCNMMGYSAILSRSYADFALRVADVLSDRGQMLGVWQGKKLLGYALFYVGQETLTAPELVAQNDAVATNLLAGLSNLSKGQPISVKMPPNSNVTLPGLVAEIRPQGVCALTNVSQIFKVLGREFPQTIQVFDEIFPENHGIFDCFGEKSSQPPAVAVKVGHLLQVLVGYRTWNELVESGDATCFFQDIPQELQENFPKITCFVPDEY